MNSACHYSLFTIKSHHSGVRGTVTERGNMEVRIIDPVFFHLILTLSIQGIYLYSNMYPLSITFYLN